MKVSIFGLGYVGLVGAACLAREGHEIVGVDSHATKVQMVNAGVSPIVEHQIEDILAEQVTQGRIRATTSPNEAVLQSEISLVCVGTPSTVHGVLDLTQVENVSKQIGSALRQMTAPHTVVFRSTMLPGSTQYMAGLLSQYSNRTLGHGLHVAFNPEFLREGTAVHDFYSPPYTVVGTQDAVARERLKELYQFLSAPLLFVDLGEAELLKYANNAFHATKITFANEIGRLARAFNVNGAKVMELLCQDTVLNISPAYLRPGFAYGGSCLPKDLRALGRSALIHDIPIPLLESLAVSNQLQIEHANELITRAVNSKTDTIGFLGLAFKAGTDDLRESPLVELVERLLGKGYRLLLFDDNVLLSRLMGSNKAFVEQEIPHLAEIMTDCIDHVLEASKVLIVPQQGEKYLAFHALNQNTIVIKLENVLSGVNDS